MNIKPIPTQAQGNPLYPLPADYSELSSEGQRQARVNACRQWLIPRKWVPEILDLDHTTPRDTTQAAVDAYRAAARIASLHFYDLYYLHPDPDEGFDPGFYDDDPLPTPDFHWQIIGAHAVQSAVTATAPRGSAKSSLIRKDSQLCLISRPLFKDLYCTSSDKVGAETAQIIRHQVYNNSRLQDDWSPEYGTRMKPGRGDAPTGIEEFALSNGSSFSTYSVTSRIRGKRPRRFILDDPEYDPSASTSMAMIREYMRRLLFKIALPMVMRRECSILWLNTFISKRHFAYQAMMVRETLEGGQKVFRSEISEFDYWHRILIRACEEDPATGKLISCWPHMWPVDAAEKKALALPSDTPTLEEIKLRIGAANFNSEYMARPGDSDEIHFALDEAKHGYWIESVDPLLATKPGRSGSVIRWNVTSKTGEQVPMQMPLYQFCSTARLFMTVDTAKTAKAGSDFKVCTLMALTSDNDLFVLDIWGGRVQPDAFLKQIFKMADRWLCPTIWPELIDDGKLLAEQLKSQVATRARDELGVEHMPTIRGFNPGLVDKTSKIGGLTLRFEYGKIKLPFANRNTPHWRHLFEQIEGFNPDVEDGGLQNDDHLDTVSMSQFVIKGRPSKRGEEKSQPEAALARLLEGETHDSHGTPLAYFVDFSTLTVEDFGKVLSTVRQQATTPGASKL